MTTPATMRQTKVRKLTHGTISHGSQILDPVRRLHADHVLWHRHRSRPRAACLREHRDALHVGVIGLGSRHARGLRQSRAIRSASTISTRR